MQNAIFFQSGLNFLHILRPTFPYESVMFSFSLLTVCLCIFLRKEIGVKAACKILVKLTTAAKTIASTIANKDVSSQPRVQQIRLIAHCEPDAPALRDRL